MPGGRRVVKLRDETQATYKAGDLDTCAAASADGA